MVSDWDAGWIDVDVTDPENPTIVGDFDYAACDGSWPRMCFGSSAISYLMAFTGQGLSCEL
jgi:hypothetical protein